MGQWVLLRHELPDGSRHHDWMIERAGVAAGSLVTFRLGADIDGRGLRTLAAFDAVRIGDHRREYLAYEGPVSGGRGNVTRIDGGSGGARERSGDELEIDAAGRTFLGRRLGGADAPGESRWRLTAVGTDRRGG